MNTSLSAGVYAWVCLGLFVAAAVGCGGDGGGKPAACEPGEAGCACRDGACNDRLACNQGFCGSERGAGLRVSEPRARACDVLLLEDGASISDVAFDRRVLGTFVREAPRVALSFIATADSAIPGDAIQLRLRGAPSAVKVSKVECAGADGARLQGTQVALSE